MPVLNPFLRALFQSSVLSNALTSQNYVLLVPTTDALINGRDRENGKKYSELVEDEDFLGSHILRLSPADSSVKDGNLRESKGKAKTYVTVNSKTVIVKENLVYTNKGFRQVTQAHVLGDLLYYAPTIDAQQWLVFYISKPLTGAYERNTLSPPTLTGSPKTDGPVSVAGRAGQPPKKDVRTFNDLLNHFPMIARQMQPGLERLFNEFGKELGKPLPPPPSVLSASGSLDGSTQVSDTSSIQSNGSVKLPPHHPAYLPFHHTAYFDDEEDLMRRALETAVVAAIDLFQSVDKQQLSFLGATTDLTGPNVERLIERYVAESVHDSLLFPRLCSFHRAADHELDRRIRQMDCIDVSQVGIAIEDGRTAKQSLLTRIGDGVIIFRKMGVAGSPQQMLDILLETQKVLSRSPEPRNPATESEKPAAELTINADVLVSLLLLVIVRSQVRHLQARLSYMQRFIYIDDVESGELGYALSTLEAVLTYLSVDSGGLRKASKQNQMLWDAVKSGNTAEVRAIFDGDREPLPVEPTTEIAARPQISRTTTRSSISVVEDVPANGMSSSGNLSHVFPFQTSTNQTAKTKQKKRVHMEARSMSISSSISMLSRTATLESTLSGIEGDISLQGLAQTLDASGNSILMMAVESQRTQTLSYLLSLTDHYPASVVLSDVTCEGVTLLSAAIQLASVELVDLILNYLERNITEDVLRIHLAKSDLRGRTAAHYLFNMPHLVKRLASLLPWLQKDKIGHTPLFAICRTYDHTDYNVLVTDALAAARAYQKDGGPLRVYDHVDLKGNTLLHIINDPLILHRVLAHCDTDPNATNDRKFTPLMLASKYGRVDMVRIFFGDPRIDSHLREARGLTAVELAKDEEVRNRIDDLTLFSDNSSTRQADPYGRVTSIVRSFFVDDGSTRYVVKSGAPNHDLASTTYSITTSRRSISDFVNLSKWLTTDHPASYMPSITESHFRSPFQLHSRPSRSILYDHQLQLDRFLKMLIAHPTFSTHEMLWEFFLVPDMQQEQMELRATMKADFLQEKIADDYEPLTAKGDLDDVESVITHSSDMVRRVSTHNRNIVKRGYIYAHAGTDLAEALGLMATLVTSLGPPSTTLPRSHTDAISRAAGLAHAEPASSPLFTYVGAVASFQKTINAITNALSRPSSLVTDIRTAQKELARHRSILLGNSLPRKTIMNIQLPGMEESRMKHLRDAEKVIAESEARIQSKGKELRYTQEVVLGELAGWTSWREAFGRQEIHGFARMTLIRERERLKGLQRVLTSLKEAETRN